MCLKKYKKYSLAIILFYLSVFQVVAQLNVANTQQIEQFFKTTTCIVKDGKPFSFFNAYLKDAIDKYWSITKFKFIEENEFEKLSQNTDYSFILLSEASYKEGKEVYTLDVLNIVLGQKGKGLDEMPDLGSIPLCYAEDDETTYLYKIPALVKMIQYQINLAIKNKISSPQALVNYHNQFVKEIKNKELWLLDEELSDEVNSKDKLTKAGLPNTKIKTREELEEAIENGDDILFIHLIMPYEENSKAKMWLMVISAGDGKVYCVKQNTVKNSSNRGLGIKDLNLLN